MKDYELRFWFCWGICLYIMLGAFSILPVLGNNSISIDRVPVPRHKPFAPLTSYQIEECRSRIVQNDFFEAKGSVQRIPVAAFCDYLEDKNV